MVDSPLSTTPTGASLADLISTQKGGVQNLAQVAQSITNAYPIATASTSPVSTPVSNLGTTAAILIAASTTRHGIIFHNPGTASVYVFPSLTSSAPTLSAPGGSFLIFAGGTLSFPSTIFPNVNCGWSGFGAVGSQPLTVVEFY